MTPQKPYLIRAIYEWLVDNQTTPYLLVNTLHDGCQVPKEYVRDNRIVLNIAPDAVQDLTLDNEWISFSARFAGKAMDLFIPVIAVQAIYAKENNEGMFFPDHHTPEPDEPDTDSGPEKRAPSTEPAQKKPTLKIVK
ncbi:ClpXP protease specificity-enhancing factor [Methylophaga lonarensis]